jgi:hypothetical protein
MKYQALKYRQEFQENDGTSAGMIRELADRVSPFQHSEPGFA